MKKLFSSKSGFSLVEIIVAFAVFAVMAAMVSSIMSLALHQRSENLKFADNVEAQKNEYARIEKDLTYSSADGEIVLKLSDKECKLEYSDKSVPGVSNGINYFVGNADYKKKGVTAAPSNDEDDEGVGSYSLVSQLDSYIYGSPYFEWIRVEKFAPADATEIAAVEKKGVDIPDGKTMFVLTVTPYEGVCAKSILPKAKTNRDLIVWRNFSIRMPGDLKIIKCGHMETTKEKYEITKVSDSSVNFSIPQAERSLYYNGFYKDKDNYEIYSFDQGTESYYLILDISNSDAAALGLSAKSFGDVYNEEADDNPEFATYRVVVKKDKDGKEVRYNNIYAAKGTGTPKSPQT